MGMITRRVSVTLAAFLLSAVVGTIAAIPAQSAVQAQSAVPAGSGTPGALTGIRTGAHPTFDRIVLDFPGGTPQVRTARFVDKLVRDGSGQVEPLPGAAFAEVSMFGGSTYDANGHPTYLGPRKFSTPGLHNVMAIAITGDFEGYLTIGIGMRRQTSLNVFTLTNPARVVIDVGS
ncbi:MAG: AMIN-like domain-containing (lipo)protein [Pseudonocardiaceae bacterium]